MVGSGIWRETQKNVQNVKNTLQDLEYGEKKMNNVENEKPTHQDLEYGEKTEKKNIEK